MMIDNDDQPPVPKGLTNKPWLSNDDICSYIVSLKLQSIIPEISIPDFGIWHLTIKEAAELVTLDMWYSGEIRDIVAPKDWDRTERDPRLRALLAGHAEAFEKRLLAAVDAGRLKAAAVQRDFDERLIPEETYINYFDLLEWLRQRGYERGDIMAEWVDIELGVLFKVREEVAYLRAAIKGGNDTWQVILPQGMLAKAGKLDEAKAADAIAAYKAIIVVNQHLKEQLAHANAEQPAKVDRPVSTRERRTLLTIIAALCDHAGIDSQSRGAAQNIKRMTESLGAPIDDGTIAKALAEIPGALESRMK